MMRRQDLNEIGRDRRGMALLITIMVISLLIGVTVQFSRNIQQGFFASATQLESQRLLGIARSGIALGSALLEADGAENTVDTLQDVWAAREPEMFADLFDRGRVAIDVVDLSGRLQINSLVHHSEGNGDSGAKVNEIRQILNQILVSDILEEGSAERAREVIDSLVDWLDSDDDESEFGAESGYYLSLSPAITCRNGPIRDVSELLMVKGITPLILYGREGRPGLAEYITVHGNDGVMNLNTMPRRLIHALHPLMTEELADMLDEYRRDQVNVEALADRGWYRNVPGFPGDVELPAAMLSTKSSYFLIKSEGRLEEQVRRVAAVVERKEKGGVAIIETRME